MKKTIVIDIGGTNTRVAVMDEKLKKHDHISFETNKTDPKETFKQICKFINKHKSIKNAGISAPGPTDYINGIFGRPVNVRWDGFNMFNYIKKNTNINDIKADNDANLMALANHFHFKGTEKDITQFYTVSTGLGGGLIIDNEIYHGANGNAQEIAALPTAWKKESGKDLSEGALELFSAGSGIEYRGKKYRFKSTKDVFENYKESKDAKEIIDDGIEALANAVACSLSLINSNIVVFDGSVARHNEWYINKVIEKAKERVFPHQKKHVKFYISNLGDDSALIGAYYLTNGG